MNRLILISTPKGEAFNQLFLVNQLSSQSMYTEGDRIYPQHEVLGKAFVVPDKLVYI